MAYGNGHHKGMSPRKTMGMAGHEIGEMSPYPGSREHGSKPHPDRAARTGELAGKLPDDERAIARPVHYHKDMLPAQRAPHHGPHHERELGFDREDSKGV